MALRENLREAWELASGRPSVTGQLRAYPVDAARSGARAVVSPDGHFGLLVPVPAGKESPAARALLAGQGCVLEAEFATYVEGADRIRAFAVWCREPALNDVFVSFGEAFLERWGSGADPGSAAEICHAEFRHLLAGPKSIEKSELVGLIGEILFLADLVELSPGAIDTWCAESSERHDFRRGNQSVEIKTTLRSGSAGPVAHISAIDQLEPPVGGDLFLHLVRLEQVVAGNITLPALIARVSARVDATESERLRARVNRLGQMAVGTVTPSFALLERYTYRVGLSFPRLALSKLTTGQLDVGVRAVEYDLDLSGCRPFMVDDKVALAALMVPGGRV